MLSSIGFPEGTLLVLFFTFIFFICPLSAAILLMLTPRNFALFDLAFVIRVFSSERVSPIPLRKSDMYPLSRLASLLVPQKPINQSSAYLTYFILVIFGFGIIDFSLRLFLFNSLNSFISFSFQQSIFCIFFFFLYIFIVRA